MSAKSFRPTRAREAVAVKSIPVLPVEQWRESVVAFANKGGRLAALCGWDLDASRHALLAVLADDARGGLSLGACHVAGGYPALTPQCAQAHLFERALYEDHGIEPHGHPWLKPVRFAAEGSRIGETDFFRVDGEEIHEVAVGPVHAGVIEPGHFRFQCHGETVLHLEISLGYQHRGIEAALAGGPHGASLYQIETAAGDTTIGHTVAYCEMLEAFAGCSVPPAGLAIRGIALELERCANHTGDLGALAADVGFLPTAAFCGRLRGDFLNMTALVCGSRFGRGLVVPGGAAFDIDGERAANLLKRLRAARRDFVGATQLLWTEPSVLARFEGCGTLTEQNCHDLGLVGPAARASGVVRDVRQDFPSGVYQFYHIPVETTDAGDVASRAYVRWGEVQKSIDFLEEQLQSLTQGNLRAEMGPLAPDKLAVSLVEGWRGEICHVAMTDRAGCYSLYKIFDPSFHNWTGLAIAMRNQQISDFPLCNKSFNLSYCGHDL